MKETSKFRERYNRWKNGENYWEIRADQDLPKFQSGKDDQEELDAGVVITPDYQYNQFLNTLPANLRHTPEDKYRTHFAWNLSGKPKTLKDAKFIQWVEEDNSYHGNSVLRDPKTNIYHFLKPKTHPTVGLELNAYHNNPDLEQLRKSHKIDDSDPNYYRYIPRFRGGKDDIYVPQQAEFKQASQEPQVLRDRRYKERTAYYEKQKRDAQMQAVGKGIISMIPLVGTGIDAWDFIKSPSMESGGWLLGSAATEIIPFLKIAKAAKATKVARAVDKLQTQSDLVKAQQTAQRSLEVYNKLANNPYINPAKTDRALWRLWSDQAKMRQAQRANKLAVYNYNVANNKSFMENTVKPFTAGFAMDSYQTVHNINQINKQYTQNELRNK